ncbi:MAG: VOC family protein [Acidobacteriaceae bacterium]|nr:VOC family protein [Acidobacteriaceae bacterium]
MSLFDGNACTWFEIPTVDFDRATEFYETVLDMSLRVLPGAYACSMFPNVAGRVGGCLVSRPHAKPSANGTTVFLNVDGKLDACVKRAEKLGSTITVPRTQVPGNKSYFACLIDSEGNQIGLHSMEF